MTDSSIEDRPGCWGIRQDPSYELSIIMVFFYGNNHFSKALVPVSSQGFLCIQRGMIK